MRERCRAVFLCRPFRALPQAPKVNGSIIKGYLIPLIFNACPWGKLTANKQQKSSVSRLECSQAKFKHKRGQPGFQIGMKLTSWIVSLCNIERKLDDCGFITFTVVDDHLLHCPLRQSVRKSIFWILIFPRR